MRNRSNSGVRLDYYQRIVYRTILQHQNPVTGLVPATPENAHSWVRDNVYSVLCVWGLAMAYKKNADLDEDRAKAYELEQSCVKLMRGLLMSMMMQKEKVEKFKESLSVKDSLHAKYNSTDCRTVVNDEEWGHLQLDATSLYLLILAQMTASGLQIIFNLDEVCFIQNLVFYIESAYYIPDYGIWERGDKTNHGLPELNASSIGMAKAALEAMNELDLFGARGGPSSVIHVLADESQKCEAVLQSMLPRESNSKELDAALLSVISFPAFAVTDIDLIKYTRECIVEKLQGRYGCKRFLRDGHKTPKEDPSRLYYEPWELRMFENIECEWPLFFCYLILDAIFQQDREMAEEYLEALDEILIKTEDGLKLVPELYAVSAENAVEEQKNPHTQERIPLGRCPFMWAQSLFVLGRLLHEGFLSPGELDPLNRRLGSEKKPDVVVQIVILAQNEEIQLKLAQCDVDVKTIAQVLPIEVQPSRVLSTIYNYLGQSKKLELTGRKSKEVGILTTSKLYSLQDRIFAFTPQFADIQRFYIASDVELLIDIFKTEIAFLKSNWHMLGRPTVILPATAALLDDQGRIPAGMISTVKKLKSGYINGTRVNLGNMSDFLSTSCITSLNFLNNHEDGYPDNTQTTMLSGLISDVQYALEKELQKVINVARRKSLTQPTAAFQRRKTRFSRRTSVAGMIRRSRSFKVHEDPVSSSIPPPGSSRRVSAFSPVRHLPYDGAMGTLSPAYDSPPESDKGTRSPSPGSHSEAVEDDWLPIIASRTAADQQFEQVDLVELVTTLRETDTLEEQGDILHFMAVTHGLDFAAYIEDGVPVKVKDLLKELYGKACHGRQWALVRHSAGMLGKRVEDLAKSVTDLLVRQKQVTIGIPPYNEKTITSPMSSNELRALIHQVYGTDESTAMLTQELIVYLAMFIRTEPQMFQEMLRLRVGLIIEVMASELARTLKCPGNDASEFLMNLSPFEMKNLLHHIISGKEFGVHSARSGTLSVITNKSTKGRKSTVVAPEIGKDGLIDDHSESDRYGQWIRRRKLDGALNRVPKNFYPNIWKLLERCNGFSVAGKVVPHALTEEMTAGELKFALQVETVLNAIPQPEYRQLVVEALSVLIITVENEAVKWLGNIVHVENLVHKANEIFLDDQKKVGGDAMMCCACPIAHKENPCNGAAGICTHFFDSAPSGSYGTMTYLIRAVAHTLETLPDSGEIECALS